MKILLLSLVIFGSFGFVFAHSCANVKPLDDKDFRNFLQSVDAIFYGQISEIKDAGNQSYEIKFKIIRVWKGIEQNEISILYTNPCSEKPSFNLENKLFIYAYKSAESGLLTVDCCDLNSFDNERMKREYGEGKLFEEPQIIETGFWSNLWNKIVSLFS